MKKYLLPIALVGALSLTSCVSQPTPAVTSEAAPTRSPNTVACEDFADASMGITEVLDADNVKAPWENLRNEYDEIGLRAEGDVKKRIEALVTDWPLISAVMIYGNVEKYNEPVEAVARACDAAGTPIDVNTFVAKN